MLNIMTKDPNFVSVRLPDDVANWLREYATANKLVRADKPNMGGSIIAVIRSVMSGQTISNNVGQSSDFDGSLTERIEWLESSNTLFQTDVDKRLEAFDDNYSSLIQDNTQKLKSEIDELKEAIAPLLARIEAPEVVTMEAKAPSNFTQALLLRAKEVAPLMLQKAA